MKRLVEPEWLDELPATHPGAVRSRADLRRLNWIMGHADIFSRILFQNISPDITHPLQICELGAGDGTMLLGLARQWATHGGHAELTMVDRQALILEQTRAAFEAFHWSVTPVVEDVLGWLEQCNSPVDLICCKLFLHHFTDSQLRQLFQQVAERTSLFIACEPRRSEIALIGSHWVGFVGCNRVTRHDAVASVRAGFWGHELSDLWPVDPWKLSENRVGLFSHCFVAKRNV